MAQNFADFVDEWTRETEARMLAVFKRAVELLADELGTTRAEGGRTPKLTGNLIRSILAQVGAMPNTAPSGTNFAGADVGVVVASVLMGQSVSIGFQAAYARRLNYGFVGQDSMGRSYNQAGNGFVEAAAAAWPTLVALAAEEIRSKVVGRA